MRLISTAVESPDFDGWRLARRVKLSSLTLSEVCNLVWYWATDGADEKGRAKVEAQLMRPLPGRERVTDALVNFELAMFQKSMTQMTGKVS